MMAATSTSPSDLLSQHQIESLQSSFYYIPDFLTSSEQDNIASKVSQSTTLTRHPTDIRQIPSNRWITLSHRRLQVYPSQLTANNVLLDAPLPSWQTTSPPIAKRFEELGIFKDAPHGRANHCLVNEYKPGEGIMPHEDGAAYHPVVATVSLGGVVALDIYEKRPGQGDEHGNEGSRLITRILQEPGSLLVTMGDAYTALLHGISAVKEDVGLGPETVANWDMLSEATRSRIEQNGGSSVRGTRTSLTCRDVLKVKKVGIGILGRR